MPSLCALLMMRQAISPRLAMRIFLNMHAPGTGGPTPRSDDREKHGPRKGERPGVVRPLCSWGRLARVRRPTPQPAARRLKPLLLQDFARAVATGMAGPMRVPKGGTRHVNPHHRRG